MNKHLLFLLFICLATLPVRSQNDSTLIRQTALDYVEGYYTANWQRMTKALHPELVKRIIVKDTAGNYMLQNMGYSGLIFATHHNTNSNGTLNPGQPFKADVIIYDIYNKVATVKVVTNKFRFIDYLHLGKFNGEWKIVNVLWEFPQ
jgi:hypothetical protein